MKIRVSIFCLAVLLFTGCAKVPQPCEPVIITEYIEVKVPVVYKLSRPARPTLNDQPVPIYLKELTIYTEQLESIIDNTKKETLEKMVEINPALQDLIDKLGLEEV